MKRNVFTFLMVGLLLAAGSPLFAQSYGIYAEQPGFMDQGDFLTDPDLVEANIGPDRNSIVSFVTTGDADSVYFGQSAIYVELTDDADGKDRLLIEVGQDADLSLWDAGVLTFWLKLLEPCNDFNFELSANRNGEGETGGTDASMKEYYGLDVNNDSTWQLFMIDLADPVDGDHFTFDIFESLGFRSRGNAAKFLVDEMHISYYGTYGFGTEKANYMVDGEFFADVPGSIVEQNSNAVVTQVVTGHADSVFFGSTAWHAVFTDDAEGKDKMVFGAPEDIDMSLFNYGVLTFWIKLMEPTNDIHLEISSNRDLSGEAKGSDVSMKDNFGLDVDNDSAWQKIQVDFTEPFDGKSHTYEFFESIGFRSRGNASDFIIDEMHVVLRSGYGINAEKAGFMMEGDFRTDPDLVNPIIAADRNATVVEVMTDNADSVYFGQMAHYVNLTDDAEGKDRILFKVEQDADLSLFNNGTLIFWLKLVAPTTDINFEISANRNGGGEAKGSDFSMKDYLGLDVDNDSTWQKFMVPLSSSIAGDFFTYDVFESFSFRSRENASEFFVDEMHVMISSPLDRYVELSDVATLDTMTVSVGMLDPEFSSEVTAYSLNVPDGTSTVTVEAVPTDPNATVTGTGDIDVSSGAAQVTVTVTAEDGVTTKQYMINISYESGQSDVATLASLTVTPGTLDPEFSSNIMAYTAEAPAGTETVTVEATPTDENATVTGTGEIDVSSGSAQVTVTVTAEDGVTTEDYVIDISVATGIGEDLFPGATIYPNPATDIFTIEMGGHQVKVVSLVNLLGQTVVSTNVVGNKVTFDVTEVGEGIHVVSFDGIPAGKIVINR